MLELSCVPAFQTSGEFSRLHIHLHAKLHLRRCLTRDEFIAILKESAADMPGCLSYIVAGDPADENAIWVTEVWDSMASHDASLSLPAVQNAMVRAKPLVAAFDKTASTTPIWGAGLRTAHAR
jgi:quinol monooxygenase YgiN